MPVGLVQRIARLETANPLPPAKRTYVLSPAEKYQKLVRDYEKQCSDFQSGRLVCASGRVRVGDVEYINTVQRQALEKRAQQINDTLAINPGGLFVLSLNDIDELLAYAAQGFSLLPGECIRSHVLSSKEAYSLGVKLFTEKRLAMTLDIQAQLGQQIPKNHDEILDWLRSLRDAWQRIEDGIIAGELG